MASHYSPAFEASLTDDYGLREGDRLTDKIVRDIERELTKAGIEAAQVNVTILKATPNRPTFAQLGARPGLDAHRSFGVGGMKLQASVLDADGQEIGALEYGWYETDIRYAQHSGTWTDAKRASGRFARRLVQQISG